MPAPRPIPLSFLLIGIFLVSSCRLHTVRVDALPEVIEKDESFKDNQKPVDVIDQPWWTALDRPELTRLIQRALKDNFTIKQAAARLAGAKTLIDRDQAAYLPEIGIFFDQRWTRFESGLENRAGQYGANLQWEIDLFNRIGYGVDVQTFAAAARAEDLAAVQLSISAQIAQSYFALIAAKNILKLLEQQVSTDERLLSLIELRETQGVGTRVEVLQQKSRVSDSLSLIPLAEAEIQVNRNRIATLLGSLPIEGTLAGDAATLNIEAALPELGIPLSLLQNRPDLKAARATLLQADASIGVAIANRLPSLNISSTYQKLVDNVNPFNPVATAAGSLFMPILDWGRRKAEVTRNEHLYEEQLAAFTELYLTAIEEVRSAMVRTKQQQEYLKRLEIRESLLQKTVDLTEARYKEGVDDYLPVLNALQELRVLERSLITEKLQLVNLRIELHRALGGPIYDKNQETS